MTPRKRLLLVGWDSADWKIIRPLMARDQLQGVSHLTQRGVSGDLATLEPQLSPMLWTSIATGKMAYHHGVPGFTEVDSATGRVVPVSAATRKCKTVWEILGERGLKSHVVGWFATQGERHPHGCIVSNLYPHIGAVKPDQDPSGWPRPAPGTYWPENLAPHLDEQRLAPFEMDADQILRLLVPDLHLVDQVRDKHVWHLAEKLAEAYSVHGAATWLMENRPDWDFMAVYFRAIDEICHEFMPFHPPRMDGVPEADFALYQQVVNGAYRLHDLMLLRLMQLAGPDTAIVLVSDHGFHSDHLRPRHTPNVPAGITVWHRRQGVFAAAGPGFVEGTALHGAGLLDVTPTVLHYFGLPIGADMEGRVLAEAFSGRRAVEKIPSWEQTIPRNAAGAHASLSAEDSAALLDHFVALGYIEKPSDDAGEAARETRRENKWNLARAMFHTGRLEDALPLMEDCFYEFPERHDYGQLLAQIQLRLELLTEADETVAVVLESLPSGELPRLIKARIELQKGNHAAALAQLEAARAQGSDNPETLFMLARAYFNNRRWSDAESMAKQALERDPTHAYSHLILARCALRQDRPESAVESALTSIGYNYGESRAHFILGVACSRLGRWKDAEAALLNHLRFDPRNLSALRYLFIAYRGMGELDKASACEAIRVSRIKKPDTLSAAGRADRLRAGIAERAAERAAARAAAPTDGRGGTAGRIGWQRERVCPGLGPSAFGHLADDADARGWRAGADDRREARRRHRQPRGLLRVGAGEIAPGAPRGDRASRRQGDQNSRAASFLPAAKTPLPDHLHAPAVGAGGGIAAADAGT
jgi:predicted AlkP superfamily phosphohydrolase/phosphomutase/tetratricopeptide (TPR) repeat protein